MRTPLSRGPVRPFSTAESHSAVGSWWGSGRSSATLSPGGAMQFHILGPLEAVRDGSPVALGGPRQRAVLARLLLDVGRVVPADRLVDDVWDGRPPATGAKTLQKYVSELRKVLEDPVLRT